MSRRQRVHFLPHHHMMRHRVWHNAPAATRGAAGAAQLQCRAPCSAGACAPPAARPRGPYQTVTLALPPPRHRPPSCPVQAAADHAWPARPPQDLWQTCTQALTQLPCRGRASRAWPRDPLQGLRQTRRAPQARPHGLRLQLRSACACGLPAPLAGCRPLRRRPLFLTRASERATAGFPSPHAHAEAARQSLRAQTLSLPHWQRLYGCPAAWCARLNRRLAGRALSPGPASPAPAATARLSSACMHASPQQAQRTPAGHPGEWARWRSPRRRNP